MLYKCQLGLDNLHTLYLGEKAWYGADNHSCSLNCVDVANWNIVLPNFKVIQLGELGSFVNPRIVRMKSVNRVWR